jgi:glycerol-3-phosphate dehydrogenase (NAD(P)+)
MSFNEPVGLVGRGARFQSLLALLQRTNTPMKIWRPDVVPTDTYEDSEEHVPEGVEQVEAYDLREVPLIFLSVPMAHVRSVARTLGDQLSGRHAIVHLCRNFEHATLKTVSQVLEEETPTRRFGFLTGPMRPEDVTVGLPAAGVCATHFPEVQDTVEDTLVGPGFRLYRSSDLVGAEIAAAYSRVIALGAGVASQMGVGGSLMSTLHARGLAEMGRFVVYRGGYERTTFGMAGSANLHADTSYEGSIDFQIGAEALKRNEIDADQIAEQWGSRGRDLLSLVSALGRELEFAGLDLHILTTCQKMIAGEFKPADALAYLMALPTLSDA